MRTNLIHFERFTFVTKSTLQANGCANKSIVVNLCWSERVFQAKRDASMKFPETNTEIKAICDATMILLLFTTSVLSTKPRKLVSSFAIHGTRTRAKEKNSDSFKHVDDQQNRQH